MSQHAIAEPATAAPAAAADPRRWIALLVILVAGLMDLVDTTIVNVAVPAIRHDLSASYASVQWFLAGYTLAFALGLITGGRLGDAFGRKRLFLIGVGGFVAASALSGAAQSPGMLIAARVLQGTMAATMVPQILSIIQVAFSAEERPKALGAYGVMNGLAAISGPIIGGLLLKANVLGLGWRPIFLVNIPIGIAVLVVAPRLISESRSPHPARLDLAGVALATLALIALLYPLVKGRELGWPAWSFACLAAVVPLTVLFVLRERRTARRGNAPLVVLGLFSQRGFAAGLVVALTVFAGVGAFFLAYVVYLQIGLGFSPLHAGLTAIPFTLGSMLMAGVSFQLAPRLGRQVLQAGALLLALGMGGFLLTIAHWGPVVTSWQVAPALLVSGLGLGLIGPPLADVILQNVPHGHAGSASGLLSTAFQLGTAIGVALIGAIYFSALPHKATDSASAAAPALRARMAAAGAPASAQGAVVARFGRCARDLAAATDPAKTPRSCAALAATVRAQPAAQQAIAAAGVQVRHREFADSMHPALWYEVGTFVLAFALLLLLPARAPPRERAAAAGGIAA